MALTDNEVMEGVDTTIRVRFNVMKSILMFKKHREQRGSYSFQ
ncbi:hypothetical protein PANA5342_2639 [Pantoea ananatis LMG 5342]|nr:hypothetical protein PANA5342_2639 [Pantoea ananatis LMG 5342]